MNRNAHLDVAAIVPFRISLSHFDWMGQFNYGVVARLKPGVALQQARAGDERAAGRGGGDRAARNP